MFTRIRFYSVKQIGVIAFIAISSFTSYSASAHDVTDTSPPHPPGTRYIIDWDPAMEILRGGDVEAMSPSGFFTRARQWALDDCRYQQQSPYWEGYAPPYRITSGPTCTDLTPQTAHTIGCAAKYQNKIHEYQGGWTNEMPCGGGYYYRAIEPVTVVCTPTVGNPCEPATGSKTQTENDYTGGTDVPGMSRTYRSIPPHVSQTLATASWNLPTSRRIRLDPVYPEDPNDDLAIVQRTNGYPLYFRRTNGIWNAGPMIQERLTQYSDGFKLTTPSGAVETYDLVGNLLSEADATGKTTYFNNYPGESQIRGRFGHVLRIRGEGAPTEVIDPAGNVIRYNYTSGNLTSVTYPDGANRIYHYENTTFPNLLTGITDENGNRFSYYQYDAQGRAILTEHRATDSAIGQERFTLSYPWSARDTARSTAVTDAAGTTEHYSYITYQNALVLSSKLNRSDNRSTSYRYAAGNVSQITNELGQPTSYTYNATRQRLSENFNNQRTTTYQYLTPDIDLPTVIESPSVYGTNKKRTEITYDTNRNPISITQRGFNSTGTAISRTVAMQYNTAGQVVQIDGPRVDVNDITTLEYYDCTTGGACGQLKSVTNALGHRTTYDTYDAHGRVLTQTDTNGVHTTYTYDLRGRLIIHTQTAADSSTRTTRYTYDRAGQLIQVIHPDASTLTYTYDLAHDLRSVADNLNNRIDYRYDVKGNRIGEDTVDASGTLATRIQKTFDIRNRLASVNHAGNITQVIHDAIGNLTETKNPNGISNYQYYDALNRLIQAVTVINGSAVANNYQYANAAHTVPTNIRAPNNAQTGYLYDDLGNLERETSADRGITQYTYDTAGNLTTQTDARGIAVTYRYDALNRLTTIDYPSDTDTAYTYDTYRTGAPCANGIGRLCQVQDRSGVTTYAYDRFGRLAQEQAVILGVGYVTRYQYDTMDRIIGITHPNGRQLHYTRDPIGRVNAIATTSGTYTDTLAHSLQYRADGLLTQMISGNGVIETRYYDLAQRLTQQQVGADSTYYTYDKNGNLLSHSDSAIRNYGFDTLDRLINDAGSALTYDNNGNRTKRGTDTYIIPASSNRLTQLNGQTLSYDPAGNTVQDPTRRYTYNDAGRLIEVRNLSNTVLGTYTDDHRALRRIKRTGTDTTIYHYDLTGNLTSETDAQGNLKAWYAYVPHTGNTGTAIPILQVRKGNPDRWTYLHTDHLYTPRKATDLNQRMVWRYLGEAFGNITPQQDPDNDGIQTVVNLRFAGQYADQESNLFYNWNRYYDPKLGRYITSDPIGLEGGLNTYAYALNNPLRYTDPTGENPLAIGGAMGAAAIRICRRIPACREQLDALIKKAAQLCKSVDCEVRFDKKGHPFPASGGGTELCMHWQIDCHIKGIKGSGFSIHSRLPICWKPGDPLPPVPPPTLP